MSIPSGNDQFMPDIIAIEVKLRALSERFYGDNVKGRLDIDEPSSLYGRLNNALYDGYGSTGDPTSTMKMQFQLAGEDFEGWYTEFKSLLSNDLRALESRLEAAGAPHTPGRVTEWKKN